MENLLALSPVRNVGFKVDTGRLLGTSVATLLIILVAPVLFLASPAAKCTLFAVLVAPVVYALPLLIAVSRSSEHCVKITLLNILIGWTIVGWVGALAWALMAKSDELEIDDRNLRTGCAISVATIILGALPGGDSMISSFGMLALLIQTLILPIHLAATNVSIHKVLDRWNGGRAGWEVFLATLVPSSVFLILGAALAESAYILHHLLPWVEGLFTSGQIGDAEYNLCILGATLSLWIVLVFCALAGASFNCIVARRLGSGKQWNLTKQLAPSIGFFAVTLYTGLSVKFDGDIVSSVVPLAPWLGAAFLCHYFCTVLLLGDRQRQELETCAV